MFETAKIPATSYHIIKVNLSSSAFKSATCHTKEFWKKDYRCAVIVSFPLIQSFDINFDIIMEEEKNSLNFLRKFLQVEDVTDSNLMGWQRAMFCCFFFCSILLPQPTANSFPWNLRYAIISTNDVRKHLHILIFLLCLINFIICFYFNLYCSILI